MSNVSAPHTLQVERRRTPLGIDPEWVRFGWRLPESVATQTAYQLRVSTERDALPADGERWDSGVVESSETIDVPYDGVVLSPRTRYFWTVRIRDESGWSPWSEPTWFETGVVDWRGEWLAPAGPKYEEVPAPAPVFRTTFDLDLQIERAQLAVAAGGTADPRVNGNRVTDRALDPGQSDYEERVLYATYDVTELLCEGENALAIVCGRERYAMTASAWGWDASPWHREHPEVRAELTVTDADGERRIVSTNDSWRVGPSATRSDCLYSGEVYDARLAADWSDSGFDDGEWSTARVVDGPAGTLVPQVCQPIEPVRTVEPETVTEPVEGMYVVDFGEMVAGWARLTVDAPRGTEIELVHGEKRTDDGTVHVKQHHLDEQIQTDRYICSGEGTEVWEPRFSYKGFRYLQIDGLPEAPTNETLRAVVAHTTIEAGWNSDFTSSDDLLNQIHDNTRRALVSNHHSVPTDTPTYEKNGWTGDAQLTAETALYNFDMVPFYRKWLADVDDSRRETGEIPPIVPTSDWGYSDRPHDGSIWSPNPGWDAAGVLVPWWCYQYGGDVDLLADQYEGMVAIVRYLETHVEDGVLDVGLGDWLPPGDGEIMNVPPEGPAATSTAYLCRLQEVIRDAAAVLGFDEDRELFASRADATRECFLDAFFDPETNVVWTGEADAYRQTPNLFALAFDLVPASHRQAVADSLAENVRDDHDGHLDTGILGTKYLLPVLTDYGYTDLAYEVATKRTYPSWGYWIENGATSLYEAWELASRSRNHHMFGSIDEWFYKYLSGIRPVEPGFETVAIDPRLPSDLDSVDATVDTVRGPVRSAWRRVGDGIRFDVTVPPNTTGLATIPGSDPDVEEETRERDSSLPRPAAPDERIGIDARRPDAPRTALELPPGTWTIRTN